MGTRAKIAVAALSVVALLTAGWVGFTAATATVAERGGANVVMSSTDTATQPVGQAADAGAPSAKGFAGGGAAPEPAPSAGGVGAEAPTVIRTASIGLRVSKMPQALSRLRDLSAENGASIQSLEYAAGTPEPQPVPLGVEGSVGSKPVGPSSAIVVLRVPAAKLDALAVKLGGLGTVLSQSAGQEDVTKQVVDLSARLRNLRAEEARVRSFLAQATKVSEMLAIERELGRLRGEIEAMQAQLDSIRHQAAMATLTVQLSEPAPVVSPAGSDWGISEAVTSGFRAAAAVIGTGITLLIAALPLAALAVAIWLLARLIARRRREARPKPAQS